MFLPNVCVECIIKHIDENDLKTLYSTALVNRNWSKVSIIRLWKNPLAFSNYSKSKSKSISNSYKIIPILLSFLDSRGGKDLKNLAKQFYVPKDTLNIYPKLQSDLKISIYNLNIPTSAPLFEYPKYIKRLNFVDLVELANKWLNSLLSEITSTPSIFLNLQIYGSLSRWEYIRYMTNSINFHCPFIHFDKNPQPFFNFILESLFQVLINHSQIDSLSIMDTSLTHHLCGQLGRHLQNGGRFLSNLSCFEFCQNINSTILAKIPCDTITTISVIIVPEADLKILIDFIGSLHSLRSVSMLGNNANVTTIVQSLQNHASTLITLKLNLCTIDDDAIKSLSKCDHLQELMFHQLHFTYNSPSTLTTNDLFFPQLKKLNYWEYSSSNSPIIWLIQNNGYHLTHLNIHTSMERCIKLFDIISKNCPLLVSLKTPISEQKDFIALFSILEHCKFLRILCIHEFNIININEDVISSFIEFIPDSLLYLKINRLEFSCSKLGCKLKNCKIISEVLLGRDSLAVRKFFEEYY